MLYRPPWISELKKKTTQPQNRNGWRIPVPHYCGIASSRQWCGLPNRDHSHRCHVWLNVEIVRCLEPEKSCYHNVVTTFNGNSFFDSWVSEKQLKGSIFFICVYLSIYLSIHLSIRLRSKCGRHAQTIRWPVQSKKAKWALGLSHEKPIFSTFQHEEPFTVCDIIHTYTYIYIFTI